MKNHPLPQALQAAVPLWQLQYQGVPHEDLQEIIAGSSKMLALNGEALLFLVPGKTADVFNALAKAIAVLSFCPGGCTCFGMTWEAKHTPPF